MSGQIQSSTAFQLEGPSGDRFYLEALYISADNKLLAVHASECLSVWNVQSGSLLWRQPCKDLLAAAGLEFSRMCSLVLLCWGPKCDHFVLFCPPPTPCFLRVDAHTGVASLGPALQLGSASDLERTFMNPMHFHNFSPNASLLALITSTPSMSAGASHVKLSVIDTATGVRVVSIALPQQRLRHILSASWSQNSDLVILKQFVLRISDKSITALGCLSENDSQFCFDSQAELAACARKQGCIKAADTIFIDLKREAVILSVPESRMLGFLDTSKHALLHMNLPDLISGDAIRASGKERSYYSVWDVQHQQELYEIDFGMQIVRSTSLAFSGNLFWCKSYPASGSTRTPNMHILQFWSSGEGHDDWRCVLDLHDKIGDPAASTCSSDGCTIAAAERIGSGADMSYVIHIVKLG